MSEVTVGHGIGREVGRVLIEGTARDGTWVDYIAVWRRDDGIVTIDAEYLVPLTPAKLAELRELLDRAAMPGQPEAVPGGQ